MITEMEKALKREMQRHLEAANEIVDNWGWTTKRPFVLATELKSKKLAKPGNLIEFDRIYYTHWAMYSDVEGMVFNIPAEGKDKSEVKITLERLEDVAKGSRVRVNDLDDIAEKLHLIKRNAEDALAAARDDYERGKLPYKLFCMNCEHYCTKWLYGEPFSAQVMNEGNRTIAKTIYRAADDGLEYLVRKNLGNLAGELVRAGNPMKVLFGNPYRGIVELLN